MEHKPSAWAVGFDMNLLAAAYAGIISSGIAYYMQGVVMKKTGPVFMTAFCSLMMIIVAIMGSFILAEKIYVGGMLGSHVNPWDELVLSRSRTKRIYRVFD